MIIRTSANFSINSEIMPYHKSVVCTINIAVFTLNLVSSKVIAQNVYDIDGKKLGQKEWLNYDMMRMKKLWNMPTHQVGEHENEKENSIFRVYISISEMEK